MSFMIRMMPVDKTCKGLLVLVANPQVEKDEDIVLLIFKELSLSFDLMATILVMCKSMKFY